MAAFESGSPAAEALDLDFGSAEARSRLGAGWSYDQRDPRSGEAYVWGTAPESEIAFELNWVRDLELSLTGRAHRPSAGSPARVELSVNDAPVGETALAAGLRTYRVAIPGDSLRGGRNRLNLRYHGGWETNPNWPARSGRPLAVSWFRLGFGDRQAAAGEPSVEGDDALLLPFGSRLDYHLRLPANSFLEATGIESTGRRTGRLGIEVETVGGGRRTLTAEPTGAPPEMRLTGEREAIVRLSLTGIPDGAEPSRRHGIRMRSPRIVTSEPPPAPPPTATPEARELPNIVIYLVDTLRADHVGAYGYDRPVSPHIDRFAGEATLFENAIAQSSWTRPTVASIFTGLWPHTHAVNGPGARLPAKATTLAQILRAAGYTTAGVVTNPNVSPETGLDRGFDHYHWLRSKNRDWPRADAVNAALFKWLDEARPEAPLLLYLHTMDPHDPYEPTPEFRARHAPGVPADFPTLPKGRFADSPEELAHLVSLYDAEIAFNDLHFGRLLEQLRARDLYDDSLIVFVSDHGEEFADHGSWKHGRTLFRESVRVPMIIKYPGVVEPLRVIDPVQQVDLMPTLLDYLGLQPPPALPGRSLLPFQSGGRLGRRQILTYLRLRGPVQEGLFEAPWQLIRKQLEGGTRTFLFDDDSDPDQLDNLADPRSIAAAYLAAELERKLSHAGLSAEEVELSDELERQLRALGYLD